MSWFASLINDQSGATAIEYAVIISILGLALGAALPEIGGNIDKLLVTVTGHVVPSWEIE